MNVINPNDPVVAMLKDLVQQFEGKLDELAGGTQEAFRLMAEGNGATFSILFQRLVAVEQLLAKQGLIPAPPQRPDGQGSEL